MSNWRAEATVVSQRMIYLHYIKGILNVFSFAIFRMKHKLQRYVFKLDGRVRC